MNARLAAAILISLGTPTVAHRLDGYLQGEILSIEKAMVSMQMTLTPGVAVFPLLIAEIDSNGDGAISSTEELAYAGRVLADLKLAIDGQPLTPKLLSMQFPTIEELKGGLGEIQIEFTAALPAAGPSRKLVFENHHQSRVAAYQVNCLVPRDPDLRILSQVRNYSQSSYELDFEQAGARSNLLNAAWRPGASKPLGTLALLAFAWLGLLWRRRVRRTSTAP
jgi:hypothetical protein